MIRRRGLISVVVGVSLVAGTASAAAESPVSKETSNEGTAVPGPSYAWQIAAADLASVALPIGLSAGLQDNGKAAFIGVPLAWTLASPSIHLAHENPKAFILSLSLRFLVSGATIGGTWAAATQPCRGDFCAFGNVVGALYLGGIVGSVVSIVDAAALAKEPPPRTEAKGHVSPDFSLSSNGARLGVTGTFR